MADKFKNISNVDTQNSFLCRLQLAVKTLKTQLNELRNKKSIKVPKLVKPTNKKVMKNLWRLV